jgi:hypothetical protein
MSQMSLIEKKVRFSAAYSLLNKIRHVLENREDNLDIQERAVLNDVASMINGDQGQKAEVIFKNSLHNMGKYSTSSSLQIIDAIEEASQKTKKGLDYYLEKIEAISSGKKLAEQEGNEMKSFLIDSLNILRMKNDQSGESHAFTKAQGYGL